MKSFQVNYSTGLSHKDGPKRSYSLWNPSRWISLYKPTWISLNLSHFQFSVAFQKIHRYLRSYYPYLEPLLRLPRRRFGYTDYTVFFAIGKTLEYHHKLQLQLELTLAWGKENGIRFEVLNIELQYFLRRRKYIGLPVHMGEMEIKANDFTMWLGIFLDIKPLFNEHFQRVYQWREK